ncbi:MAG TPA: peptidylprolyl isomerase [Rhodocyclaceae bacterium]|nr:peptidylprolyl isomerase [Rhodocyclaceae bacterium]
MNRHISATLAATALIALSPAAALAADAVATVNGKAIPQSRVDALVAAQIAQGQTDSPQLRGAVKEELVRREVLAQESEKKGFDKKADVQAQLAMTRQSVLIGAYLQDYVKTHPVSDEQVKKEYESIRATLGDKEYKARHILVDTEDEAKAVIEKLKKGDKFEDLAKQSKDPGSKDKGGDLGWANQAAYVKPFSDAMVHLEKGKFSETPVKSDFGWHVIQLDDVRELKAPALEDVKPQLTQRLQQQMVEKHVMELRAKAKVQ